MHPFDALIIVAEALPTPHGFDLVRWWVSGECDFDIAMWKAINDHPSMKWWIVKHAPEITHMLAAIVRSK